MRQVRVLPGWTGFVRKRRVLKKPPGGSFSLLPGPKLTVLDIYEVLAKVGFG